MSVTVFIIRSISVVYCSLKNRYQLLQMHTPPSQNCWRNANWHTMHLTWYLLHYIFSNQHLIEALELCSRMNSCFVSLSARNMWNSLLLLLCSFYLHFFCYHPYVSSFPPKLVSHISGVSAFLLPVLLIRDR